MEPRLRCDACGSHLGRNCLRVWSVPPRGSRDEAETDAEELIVPQRLLPFIFNDFEPFLIFMTISGSLEKFKLVFENFLLLLLALTV